MVGVMQALTECESVAQAVMDASEFAADSTSSHHPTSTVAFARFQRRVCPARVVETTPRKRNGRNRCMALQAFAVLLKEEPQSQELAALLRRVSESGGLHSGKDPLFVPWEEFLVAEEIVKPEGMDAFLSIFDAEQFGK